MVRSDVLSKEFMLRMVRGTFIILTLLFLSALGAAPIVHAQTLSFEKTWGAVNNEEGWGVAVDSTGNNVYVTGYKSEGDAGGTDVLLLKYNSVGTLQWKLTWGGTEDDFGYGVAVDGSGDIYVTGAMGIIVETVGVKLDLVLLKFDSSGALLWNKTWGGTMDDEGYGVAVDGSGNIYVTGYSNSIPLGGVRVVLLKFNSSGGLVWQKYWGNDFGSAYGRGVAVDPSGDNIYVTGDMYTSDAGRDYDILLLKVDSSGGLVWQKTWGGLDQDKGMGIAVDDSGTQIYVAGYTRSFGAGLMDVVLLRFNSLGGHVWERMWGGAGMDYSYGVAVDGSGDIYVTGKTGSFSGEVEIFDVALLKFDSLGSVLWEKTWGTPGWHDEGYGVAVHPNDVYFTGGVQGAVRTLNNVTGTVTLPTGTITSPTLTLGTPTINFSEPTILVSTPSGSETYAGAMDVFLLAFTYDDSPSVLKFRDDVLEASSNTVWFVLGDYVLHTNGGGQFRSSAPKGSPLVPAIATDIFAAQYFYGGLANPQNVILDTDSRYISQATGDFGNATGISDGVIATVGGPRVNQVVYYYMFNTNETQLFYDSAAGAIKRRDTNATVTSEAASWTSDVFVVESFVDAQGREVYMVWGKVYLGTMAATCFMMDVLMKPTNPYGNTSWFVVRWTEATSGPSVNGMPDAGDTFTVIANGPPPP